MTLPTDLLFQRECQITARNCGNAELLDAIDRSALEDDPFDPAFQGCSVARYRQQTVHRYLAAELDRRKRVAEARQAGQPTLEDRYRAWCAIAKEVRERISLPWLFDHLGYLLSPAGTNGRRDAEEWCGACPLCGGTDRLRVWAGPNGRAWCRQCGWSADAIVAAQSLNRSLVGFYPAVRFLAGIFNIPLPEAEPKSEPTKPQPPGEIVTFPSGVTFTPLRKGGSRVR